MPALSSLAARDTAIERRSILFGFVHQATSLLQLNDYQAPEIAPAVRSGSRTARRLYVRPYSAASNL